MHPVLPKLPNLLQRCLELFRRSIPKSAILEKAISAAKRSVLLYMYGEALFFLYYQLRGIQIQPRSKAPKLDEKSRDALFFNCIDHVGRDTTKWLRSWHFDAPLDQMKRENVEEFIAWGFMSSTVKQLSNKEAQIVKEYVDEIEKRRGAPFKPGITTGLKSMTFTNDPITFQTRPFIYYAVTHYLLGEFVTNRTLRVRGLTRRTCGNLTYWSTPNIGCDSNSSTGSERPIVFIHGIGVGLAPYLLFVDKMLEQSEGRQVFLVRRTARVLEHPLLL